MECTACTRDDFPPTAFNDTFLLHSAARNILVRKFEVP